MKLEQRIYCVEGIWDWGSREVEPSVEPMLQQMRNMGLWPYVRRDCATEQELEFYLKTEWWRCKLGSCLYLATHGWAEGISLSEGRDVTLEQLALCLGEQGAEGCLVHFSGCEVMQDEARVREFMTRTNAAAVSGYTKEGGWTSATDAPTLALELLLFSTIRTDGIDLTNGRLRALAANLAERFSDCGFELLTRLD